MAGWQYSVFTIEFQHDPLAITAFQQCFLSIKKLGINLHKLLNLLNTLEISILQRYRILAIVLQRRVYSAQKRWKEL